MVRRLGFVIVALAASLLAGCAPTATTGSMAFSSIRASLNEAEALASVNAYRRAGGLAPVRLDPAVTRAARAQSVAMASQGVMSHDAGGDFRARLAASGVRAAAVENIAWGQRNFAEAMQTWSASSSHARNLSSPEMARLGVAVANGATGPYWTLVMASDGR